MFSFWGKEMIRILHFLSTDGSFLFENYDCRIVDSRYVHTFGGTGSVKLRYRCVDLLFWLERDLLFLDFQAAGSKSKKSWYSLDIVMQLLTGVAHDTSRMDPENVTLLNNNLDAITNRFTKSKLVATEVACKKYKLVRSKRLFG